MSAARDIFLSYSREDQALAHQFAEGFEQEGFTVWWDATLRSGDAYDAVTEEALATAKAVVVLWSATSVASRWVRAEATEAERSGKLIPVMIEPCKRPIMFELRQTAELAHWSGNRRDPTWNSLVDDVRRFVARSPDASAGAPVPAARRAASPAARRLRRWMLASVALGLAVLALLATQVVQWIGPARAAPVAVTVFTVQAPARTKFVTSLGAGNSAPVGGNLSPDGRLLAFTAKAVSGEVMLWLRPLDSAEARALPGTEDAALPFWSPDGRSIGFFTMGKLKRIEVAGGLPVELCDIDRGQGGSWSRDGVIIFSPGLRAGLMRISAEGGVPEPALALAEDHRAYRFPYFLADGHHFLYYVEGARVQEGGVHVAELGRTKGKRLFDADSAAVPAASDRLLFVRQGKLFAQRFDAGTLQLRGEPVHVAQSVPFEGAAPAFSASDNGVLSYRSGPADTNQQQFAWFDRAGRLLGKVGLPGPYRGMDLSPDGTRVAVHAHEGVGGDIWVIEPRGTTTRITLNPAQDNSGPVWSPDGRYIAFGSLREGKWGIWIAATDNDGSEQLLYESAVPKTPGSWSPDGRYIVFWQYEDGVHPWLLPVAGGAPRPLFGSLPFASHTQISPDGKWIAYMSNVSGRGEIYVRGFPDGEGAVQVSTAGGATPRWRRDGRELYYWTAYDQGKLMAVPVDGAGTAFKADTPVGLFGLDLAIAPHSTVIQNYHTYDVSPDGKRFVVPVPVSELAGDTADAPITIVLNWMATSG